MSVTSCFRKRRTSNAELDRLVAGFFAATAIEADRHDDPAYQEWFLRRLFEKPRGDS
jgi:hypothetical protein